MRARARMRVCVCACALSIYFRCRLFITSDLLGKFCQSSTETAGDSWPLPLVPASLFVCSQSRLVESAQFEVYRQNVERRHDMYLIEQLSPRLVTSRTVLGEQGCAEFPGRLHTFLASGDSLETHCEKRVSPSSGASLLP